MKMSPDRHVRDMGPGGGQRQLYTNTTIKTGPGPVSILQAERYMATELDTFYKMVDDIEIAMMTTRRTTGISNRARWQRRNARRAPTCGS